MQFGIALKPDISIERIIGLTRQAEGAGFEYGWVFDSHVLWKEPLGWAQLGGIALIGAGIIAIHQ